MGGLGGHMNHLYDNPRLTFGSMMDIMKKAAKGELIGTEKTDGQNLFLSFSVPKQKLEFTEADSGARAARNKGNVKSGGLSTAQIIDKFKDHANPELKKSFGDALKAFEKVVRSFPRDKQIEIFGPDTDIYYNAEIINPDTPNVINYDKKYVTIHRGGGGYFDKETGGEKVFTKIDDATGEEVEYTRDVSANADILAAEIDKITQDLESQQGFEVIMDAVFTLQGLAQGEDSPVLQKALRDIQEEISSEGLSGENMVIEYLIARVGRVLQERGLDLKNRPELQNKIIKRIILTNPVLKRAYGYDKIPTDLRPSVLTKGLNPREKNIVLEAISNPRSVLKDAVSSLENIVHDFTVDILEGVESLFILDQKKATDQIRDKVRSSMEAIKSSDRQDWMSTLMKEMEKLKDIDRISTAAEGFVFDYDGSTYKFTGNFAPINQLLGIGKYDGRGTLPSLDEGRSLESMLNLVFEEQEGGKYVVLIPGGFKPPHKGHYEMFKHYADNPQVEKVVVMTGPSPRGGVTHEMTQELFDAYGGLPEKVEYEFDKNPYRALFEKLGENSFVNRFSDDAIFVLGCGDKDDDGNRPANFKKWWDENPEANELEVNVGDLGACPAILQAPDVPFSSTVFRNAIISGDDKIAEQFIPNDVSLDTVKEILSDIIPSPKNLQETILSLIEEMIEEKESKDNTFGGAKTFKGKVSHIKKTRPDVDNPEAYVAAILRDQGELDEISTSGMVAGYSGPRKKTLKRN